MAQGEGGRAYQEIEMTFCIQCPPSFATETETFFQTRASYKYHQLEPMCAEHYRRIISEIELIIGRSVGCHSHLLKDKSSDRLNQDSRRTWND